MIGIIKWPLKIVWFVLKWPLVVLVLLLAAGILTWRLKWAVLVKEADLPAEALKGRHNDWWWIISWVPRRWTAFVNGPNPKKKYPKMLFGNTREMLVVMVNGVEERIVRQDVPELGKYCVSWPPHIAWRTKTNKLRACGIRKTYWGDTADINDGTDYWTAKFAWHRI